jgi:hypothetical protein
VGFPAAVVKGLAASLRPWLSKRPKLANEKGPKVTPGAFLPVAIPGLREYPKPRYGNGATGLPAIGGIAYISVIGGITRSG